MRTAVNGAVTDFPCEDRPMGEKRRKRTLILALVGVELVMAVFAWMDLNRRSDEDVRGGKRLWRLAIIANPGNSAGYWILGRRRL